MCNESSAVRTQDHPQRPRVAIGMAYPWQQKEPGVSGINTRELGNK